MHADTFIEELRRVESNSQLFLCRHLGQARRWGVHFACLQIWDKSPATGEPYPLRPIATRDGLPREPTDIDFAMLAKGRMENVCGGRTSWKELEAMRAPRQEDEAMEKKIAEWKDFFRHQGYPDAMRVAGHRKVFSLGSLDARPNRRRRRAAQAQRSRR